eukprot:3451114-Rhodomonas_salina.7
MGLSPYALATDAAYPFLYQNWVTFSLVPNAPIVSRAAVTIHGLPALPCRHTRYPVLPYGIYSIVIWHIRYWHTACPVLSHISGEVIRDQVRTYGIPGIDIRNGATRRSYTSSKRVQGMCGTDLGYAAMRCGPDLGYGATRTSDISFITTCTYQVTPHCPRECAVSAYAMSGTHIPDDPM